jgi:hypothetical protein
VFLRLVAKLSDRFSEQRIHIKFCVKLSLQTKHSAFSMIPEGRGKICNGNSRRPHDLKSRDSSVGIALGYGLDDRDSRVRFPAGLGIFLFTTVSGTALGPTQPPIQWVPGVLSLKVHRPEREAERSPPCSTEVKNAWSYISTPPVRLHGLVLS